MNDFDEQLRLLQLLKYECPESLKWNRDNNLQWWKNMVGDSPTQEEFERRCNIARYF